jgi:ferredoxin-NADP reductase
VADVLTLRIRAVIEMTPRTRVLRLDLDGSPLVFQAGQGALIGLHGQPQRRPYSIASAPEEAARHGRLEFLLKVDAAGYAGPHLPVLDVGARVDLEGPFGSFTLPEPNDAPGYLFVAGGTGISPLRAMMRHLVASGEKRPISLVYSARTPDEFAYRKELEHLARRHTLALTLTVTGGVESDEWSGARGRIGIAQLQEALPGPDPICFVCGPPALVDEIPALLRQLGVQSTRIRTEEW